MLGAVSFLACSAFEADPFGGETAGGLVAAAAAAAAIAATEAGSGAGIFAAGTGGIGGTKFRVYLASD